MGKIIAFDGMGYFPDYYAPGTGMSDGSPYSNLINEDYATHVLDLSSRFDVGLDLGSAKEVGSLKVYARASAQNPSTTWLGSSVDTVTVYGSNNNSSYTLIETFNAPALSVYADNVVVFTLEFSSAQTYRYFKIYCNDALKTTDTGTLGATEVEAYETASVTLSTDTTTNLTTNSATLNGSVDDMGGQSSLDVSIQYRTGSNEWTETTAQTLTAAGSVTADITDLSPGTEYDFRIKATDGSSTWYSTESNFTTHLGSVYVDGEWKYFANAWKCVSGVWTPVTSITKTGDTWNFNTT